MGVPVTLAKWLIIKYEAKEVFFSVVFRFHKSFSCIRYVMGIDIGTKNLIKNHNCHHKC